MSLTLLGTTPEWGIASAQTGILMSSQEEDWQISERYHIGRKGNEEGVALYNARCNISLSGEVPESTPFSARIGTTLTLANALTAFGNESVAVGTVYLFGVRKSYDRENWQTFQLTARSQPNFGA